VDDKGKGKNIAIGDPRTLSISQGGIARKAPDRKTNKFGGTRGRLSRAAKQSSLTRVSRMVRHLHADGLVLKQTVRLTQLDSPPILRGTSLHTKKKGDIGAKQT
jgi:hypothetical protein